MLPSAVTVEGFTIVENQITDITTDSGFENEGHWQNKTYGNAILDFTNKNPGEGLRSLYIKSRGSQYSNTSLTYVGSKATEFYEISPNLVLRLKMKNIDRMGSRGESFLAISTFIVWNNKTLIPLRIAIGDFQEESETVMPSGILIIRKISEPGEWQDYVLQMSKTIGPAVSYLKTEKSERAFMEDDFRAFGIAIFPVNLEFELDTLAYSHVTPAQIALHLKSNTITPMENQLTRLLLNNSEIDFLTLGGENLPFASFTVQSQIARPLIEGETLVFQMDFLTGQTVIYAIKIDKSARWI